MGQMACNAIDEAFGYLRQHRYVLHNRDTKFCASFRAMLATGNVKCIALPPRSSNLNAFVERWVRSIKRECLSRLILFGEGSLRRALTEFLEHYHAERNHQGKGNVLLFPSKDTSQAGPGSKVSTLATPWRALELLLPRRMSILTITGIQQFESR